ncbi:MAG: phosphoglucosamine mutase [candidate division KSB1 bacterium]|nr:phosphoglucosamine mutase [candidate division KSB1 bacterium]MDZ7303991.1 phosphoglucosamine mutase [candidate division KSB1 bacterium]MDZ7313299.1 phosphoglucosamine mutase [candidate division KSB1 bacterium]
MIITISGIRGVIGESLTPDVALSIAQAFGTYCQSGRVVLGRDSRVSGPMLHHAVTAGLMAVGCEVIDIGIAPTPTTKIATHNLNAAGGLVITASHNPVMWNGLKMLARDGLFLDEQQGSEVLAIRDAGTISWKSWDQLGKIASYDHAIADHLTAIYSLSFLDAAKIRQRRFRVVADCVNGAGGAILAKLLEHFGCEVVLLNDEPTGRFPHNPEPVPENLGDLCAAVKKHHAHIGLAVDPDADRLALVSEKGIPLGEEYTLALATEFLLHKRKGKVVVNLSTSMVIDDIAAKHGCPVERTKVGEIHVAKHMREVGAVIGGEGNGGVILPDVHLGRDAMVGVAMILQQLAEFGGSLSDLNASLPQYVLRRRKVELKSGLDPKQILQKLVQKYRHETIDTRDGIKILRDKAWVQVRASNTEPILRIMAEATAAEIAEKYCDELAAVIEGGNT